MKQEEIIRKTAIVLGKYLPSPTRIGARFIGKDAFITLIGPIERIDLLKILRIGGFQDTTSKIGQKTTRGYWVVDNELGYYDADRIRIKPKVKIRPLIFDNEQAVINHITTNWQQFKDYMTEDFIEEFEKDQTLYHCSTFKKNKAIELAGFTSKFVENPAIRVEAPRTNAIERTPKRDSDLMKALHPGLFNQ